MKRSRPELVDMWGSWLKRWRWDLCGTLTLTGYPSDAKADRLFARWIADVEERGGTKTFRWGRVLQRSGDRYNVHSHVLLGGMRSSARRCPSKWWKLWRRLSGYGFTERFDPDQWSAQTPLRCLMLDQDVAITFCFKDSARTKSNPVDANHQGAVPRSGGSKR
jgi:hypothetical protein